MTISESQVRDSSSEKPLIIIKAGVTASCISCDHGDFEDWVKNTIGADTRRITTVHVREGESLPSPETVAGAIITGAHEMVTDRLEWSVLTERWIVDAVRVETPLLGICYGHQLLTQALGGVVGNHPDGTAVGVSKIYLTENAKRDPLFARFPTEFDAAVAHTQSALELPAGAQVLARNEHEPHYAFRFGKHTWGVQFHPEFSTPVIRKYVEESGDEKLAGDKSIDGLLRELRPTPVAAGVLPIFARYCFESE